jgi:hypothetical protein
MALLHLVADAPSRRLARFYPADTAAAPFGLLGRWPRPHGRPLALDADRHSISQPPDRGRGDGAGQPQFGRAPEELDIELVRAPGPQAQGRVERPFGTGRDRWVKELRLAPMPFR